MLISSDPTDANDYKTLPGGAQEGSMGTSHLGHTRYAKDAVLLYVKSPTTDNRAGVLTVLFTLLICLLCTNARAQTVVPRLNEPSAPAPVVTPALTTEERIRMRDVQYAQDRALIDMLKAETAFMRAKERVAELQQQIQSLTDSITARTKVDRRRFGLDLDTLIFVPLQEKPK